MRDPLELRSLARKCRMVTDASLSPSVNKQLWLWATELAEMADEVERGSEDSPPNELVVLKHRRDPYGVPAWEQYPAQDCCQVNDLSGGRP